MCFASVNVVHPYSSMDTATTWKKSRFILSMRSDFHMIDNLSIAVLTFARCMLTSLSLDEILPRYANSSTNYRRLPFKSEMVLLFFSFSFFFFLFKTHVLHYIWFISRWVWYLLLLALGKVVGILLWQGNLGEVLDHLHSLRLSWFLRDIICSLPFFRMWNHVLLLVQ